MGADMLLTYTYFPTYRNGDRVAMADLPEVAADRIARWQQRDTKGLANDDEVVEYWRDQLDRLVQNEDLDPEDYYLDPVDSDAPLSGDEVALIRRQLTADVATLADVERDELTPVTIGDTTYLFTGGPSWGDAPTEAYEPIERIGFAGLFEIPFPGPKED